MEIKRRKVIFNKKEVILKEVNLTHHQNSFGSSQFLARIPKVVEDFLEIKKGDKLTFIIEVAPHPKPKQRSKLKFEIVKGDRNQD